VNTWLLSITSNPIRIGDDFEVTLLFTLGGLVLSFALLSVNPEALAVLGAY
jgi:hypothetical protein